MNDYDPTSPDETFPARAISGATTEPSDAAASSNAGTAAPIAPASTPDWSASVTTAEQERKPKVRRVLTKKKCRRIVAAAMLAPMIGLSVGLLASPVASAAQPASNSHSAGPLGSAGGGSNSLWPSRRGVSGHGHQRVQVNLHHDDLGGSEGHRR
jgi:hypothetical protein